VSQAQHDSETLAEGQQVFTACAFIWHEFDGVKKVFLPKRADAKKFLPGVYELPGGHIDYGEDMREGLAREIMEELGMHVEIGDVLDVFTYMNEVKRSQSIEVIYFAQFTDPLENIHLNP
jgi:8-oxo-dGTP diphosphatase